MSMIETNISHGISDHDTIRFDTIERQVYRILEQQFPDISYHRDGKSFVFILDRKRIIPAIKKNGVRLSIVKPVHEEWFADHGPSIFLEYNKDVTKKVERFRDAVRTIQDLENRASKLINPNEKEIREFLNKELATEEVRVSYWNQNLIDGREIAFYLHPANDPPGFGISVCIEKDTNKIQPFWNNSKSYRKHCFGEPDQISDALGKPKSNINLNEMKKRIIATEKLQSRIDAIDLMKNSAMRQLLESKSQGDALFEEFCKLKDRC